MRLLFVLAFLFFSSVHPAQAGIRPVRVSNGNAAEFVRLPRLYLNDVAVRNGTVAGAGSGWVGVLNGFQARTFDAVNCSATNVVDRSTGAPARLYGFEG